MKKKKQVKKANKKTNNKLLIILPTAIVMLIGTYFLVSYALDTPSNNVSNSTVNKIEYTNGTYEESISYQVPKGSNTLTAKITIKDDLITEISTIHIVNSNKSREYTNRFDEEITDVVVGKKIGQLDIGLIGGASGTSNAFKAIIEAIKQEN